MMAISPERPLAIYYEHPDWFRPLFTELERREIPYVKLHAGNHSYDPSQREARYSLFFNRMSPSAFLRGGSNSIFYTLAYLAHLKETGVRVINGHDAYAIEISKAKQLDLLASLKLPYPRARVINHPRQASSAAEGLRFPVAVKPNIGGSGAGVRRFDNPDTLKHAAETESLDLGVDSTALVQEFVPATESRIVRVEVLGGKYLYGIRIYAPGDSFDLCPADVCQRVDGTELARSACAVDAPRNRLRVEAYTPPPNIIEDVEKIMAAANIDVGGVEYMIDSRDGEPYFYDVNALSNFVADGPQVIGFDPYARLVDYLVKEAQ